MKKNIFRLLCVTLLAGMAFVSCERENITSGKHTVTVTSANEQMGKAYGGGQFDAGSTVRIWGTPEIGYQFDRWNDGNTDNPRNITVSGDVTYTAYFKAVGSDPDTNGGGGGETPGQFTATVVVDGTPYSGIALVSTGQSDNLFNLAIYGDLLLSPISCRVRATSLSATASSVSSMAARATLSRPRRVHSRPI